MATFEAKIHALRLEPHPNADLLELAVVGGYRCVVQKGKYKDGDLAAYIPEGAIVPADVIAELGLEGRLAGPDMNRVKAIKLRGVLSQGLVYPADGERFRRLYEQNDSRIPALSVGDGVTLILGLAKYEPPIPTHMQGEVDNAFGMTLNYDIEDVKKWPDVLQEGEPVRMTEKLHGTWCCLGWHPDHDANEGAIVTSKGMSAKGLVFKLNEANENNLYVQAWRRHEEAFHHLRDGLLEGLTVPMYLLGEIFGPGVQNMHYGLEKPAFRAFDVYVGVPGQGRFMAPQELEEFMDDILPLVPTLYEGPFSTEAMLSVTDGQTEAGGLHIREGTVIRPMEERRDAQLGRVILKSVSGDYLTGKRKGRRRRKKAKRRTTNP